MKINRVNTNPHISKYTFSPNGNFPNNDLPVILYNEALNLPKQKNKATDIAQRIILNNGWSNTWRNGIYDFHHYHSNTHECLAITMGNASIIIGGPGGRRIDLTQGDVIILPAGTGHMCIEHSPHFVCVGAYPQGYNYDMNYGTEEELAKAKIKIPTIPVPKTDPIFGTEGFLKMYWK